MRCDDVLIELETGNWLQRARARLHVRNCPGCAAATAMLAELKRDMANAPPVSAGLRDKWIAAATDMPDRSAASMIRGHSVEVLRREKVRTAWYVTALAATLLLALIPISRWWSADQMPIADKDTPGGALNPRVADKPLATSTVTAITTSPINAAAELDELDTQLERLNRDLAELVDKSEQLAAQQQLNELLATHRRWQETGM